MKNEIVFELKGVTTIKYEITLEKSYIIYDKFVNTTLFYLDEEEAKLYQDDLKIAYNNDDIIDDIGINSTRPFLSEFGNIFNNDDCEIIKKSFYSAVTETKNFISVSKEKIDFMVNKKYRLFYIDDYISDPLFTTKEKEEKLKQIELLSYKYSFLNKYKVNEIKTIDDLIKFNHNYFETMMDKEFEDSDDFWME